MGAILAAAAPPLLEQLAILVVGGAFVAYVSQRIGTIPIVGFLVAGVAIGPNGFGLVGDRELVDQTAEIGVLLLLFTIGLELSVGELQRMGALLFVGGTVQVGLTTALVAAGCVAAGTGLDVGIYTGFLVSLSSTAIVLKLLADRGRMSSPDGRVGVSFLIFQDLAIVAMVLLVPMLGEGGGGPGDLAFALAKAVGLIVVVLVGARRVVPRLVDAVARTCSPEVFLLTVIGLCFGTAYATSLLGISISLGAFLAGLVVSESRFHVQAMTEILPLQVLFSATFFVSVGMLLDLGFVVDEWPLVLGAVAVVLVVKVLATTAAAAVLRQPLPVALASGFLLAQIGEFSFVLERTGREAGLSPADLGADGGQVLVATTVVLMAATPGLGALGEKLAARVVERRGDGTLDPEAAAVATAEDEPVDLEGHVVLAGYGRLAASLAGALELARVPFVITTLSPAGAAQAERLGRRVIAADAARQRTLELAGLPRARVLVIADDEPAQAERIAVTARALAPTVPVLVHTRLAVDGEHLARADGVHAVDSETATADLLAGHLLAKYGMSGVDAERLVDAARQRFEAPPAPADTSPGPAMTSIDPQSPVTVEVVDGCGHAPVGPVTRWPSAPGCETCLAEGGRWVHLRLCLTCGHIGCCDSSPGRHASAHHSATAHAVVRSLEPGETWAWCYADEVLRDTR